EKTEKFTPSRVRLEPNGNGCPRVISNFGRLDTVLDFRDVKGAPVGVQITFRVSPTPQGCCEKSARGQAAPQFVASDWTPPAPIARVHRLLTTSQIQREAAPL